MPGTIPKQDGTNINNAASETGIQKCYLTAERNCFYIQSYIVYMRHLEYFIQKFFCKIVGRIVCRMYAEMVDGFNYFCYRTNRSKCRSKMVILSLSSYSFNCQK